MRTILKPGARMAVLFVFLLIAAWTASVAVANDPYADWKPPYRVLYGGYSMEPNDWNLWDGVFNLVHHSLVGRDPAETKQLLDEARKHSMKIMTTALIWNPKTQVLDDSKLKEFVERFKDDPALFGYVYEAAYRIPPEVQKQIYDAIKRLDPSRPVWSEFSSTSGATWKLFNPEACDAVWSYNYPYEKKDRSDAAALNRVSSSVGAIQSVGAERLPVIPILQAFWGTRWRPPPRGGMAAQFDLWLNLPNVAGVSFYRWRPRNDGVYSGILSEGSADDYNYMWLESQALCRQVALQPGPFVDAAAWREAAGLKMPSAAAVAALKDQPLPPAQVAGVSVRFESKAMLVDQDWEDTAEGTQPPADWSVRSGTVVSGGALGTRHAIRVNGEGLAFTFAQPTDAAEAVQLTFAIKPLEKGHAKGMVSLSDASSGYITVGLRLGHGSGANSDVFSYLNEKGNWVSLGIPFTSERWYRVVITTMGDSAEVLYQIEDLETGKSTVRKVERRSPGRGFRDLKLSRDSADAVVLDEIRLETGVTRTAQ